MNKLVFVYGSLKKGYWNNYILRDSEFIGEATTVEEYALTDCGFPYLIPKNTLGDSERLPTARVLGEVYRVTDEEVMERLDALEGVSGGHYKHHTVRLQNDGVTFEATAYIPCEPEMAALHESCDCVGGLLVWREYA